MSCYYSLFQTWYIEIFFIELHSRILNLQNFYLCSIYIYVYIYISIAKLGRQSDQGKLFYLRSGFDFGFLINSLGAWVRIPAGDEIVVSQIRLDISNKIAVLWPLLVKYFAWVFAHVSIYSIYIRVYVCVIPYWSYCVLQIPIYRRLNTDSYSLYTKCVICICILIHVPLKYRHCIEPSLYCICAVFNRSRCYTPNSRYCNARTHSLTILIVDLPICWSWFNVVTTKLSDHNAKSSLYGQCICKCER